MLDASNRLTILHQMNNNKKTTKPTMVNFIEAQITEQLESSDQNILCALFALSPGTQFLLFKFGNTIEIWVYIANHLEIPLFPNDIYDLTGPTLIILYQKRT